MKKKKVYNGVSDSDDSTNGSDNNYAILQHNKGKIAVKSDEEEDIQEENTQEEDKEEDKTGEYLEVLKYSLEQYIGFVVRQAFILTTVDFIRSEGKLKTKHLY